MVSTGGGIVLDEGTRRTMDATGIIVCLEARADTIYRRLSGPDETHDEQVVRPLLQDSDPLRRIISLKAERQPLYALAQWTIHTDELSVTEVASEVVRARDICSNRASSAESYDADLAATVRTSSGDYPVWVGWGLSHYGR